MKMPSPLLFILFATACAAGPRSLSGEEAKGLRVVTYNIRYNNPGDGLDRWENRKQTVAKFLDEQADIAGLQEVTHRQFEELKKLLPDFASYGIGRDDGKNAGEATPIFYRKEKFKKLDIGSFWLSETPQKVGSKSWDSSLPRIASWMKLQDKETGKTLFVCSTHFDHRGDQARRESASLLVKKLPQMAEKLPIVLVGDFNAGPNSPAIERLTEKFHDTRKLAKEPKGPNGTFNGFKKINEGRIDFIFVSDGISVAAQRTFDPRTPADRFASDHLPVKAVLQFK